MTINTDTRQFLEAIYGQKLPSDYILRWTLQDKTSLWFPEIAKMADLKGTEKKDTYFEVCLSGQDYGPKRRCPVEDIVGVPALWVDIDVAGPAHKKKNLPPDMGACRKLLEAAPLEPSIVWDSGHGCQAIWLLDEIWRIESDEDRKAAITLAFRWGKTLEEIARKQGYELDAVQDLARVLRLPGTFNWKIADDARPVKILSMNPDIRYTREEFERCLSTDAAPVQIGKATIPVNFKLDPDAWPPGRAWEALRESNKAIQDSWDHKRKDMKDSSISAYDMALATFAADVDWTDQEIVDLLIAHRAKWKQPKMREDYFTLTLAKARQLVNQRRLKDNVVKISEQDVPEVFETVDVPEDATSDQRRELLLQNISAFFGIKFLRIIKYVGDEPQTEFIVERFGKRYKIPIGPSENLAKQSIVKDALLAHADFNYRIVKREQWEPIVPMMLQAMEYKQLGPEATEEGIIRVWLTDYFTKEPLCQNIQEATSGSDSSRPFLRDGNICFFINDFRNYLAQQKEAIGRNKLVKMLNVFGAYSRTFPVYRREDRKPTSMYGYWTPMTEKDLEYREPDSDGTLI
jgi:hypothetical protein